MYCLIEVLIMNKFSFPLLMLLLLVPGLLYAQSSSSSSSSPAFDFTVQMGQGCFTTIAHRSVNGAGAVTLNVIRNLINHMLLVVHYSAKQIPYSVH